MEHVNRVETILKAMLPIVEDLDLDFVIHASIVLSQYFGKLAEKEDVTDEQFINACAMLVAWFDGYSIHYLEECIQEFKEEVF